MTVSQELKNTEEDLNNILKGLVALKGRAEVSTDELAGYQHRLDAVDSSKKDGKFVTRDGSVPEGQGTLATILAQCYEIVQELNERAQLT